MKPHAQIGPWLIGDRDRAELVVPIVNGTVDTLRFVLTRAQLALLAADAARILADQVQHHALTENESVGSASLCSAAKPFKRNGRGRASD